MGVDLRVEGARASGLAVAGALLVGALALALGRGAVGFKAGLFAAGWLFLGWGLLRAKPRPPNAPDDRQGSRETDPGGESVGGFASSVRFSTPSVDADHGAAVRWLLAGGTLLASSLLLELAGVGV